MDQQMKYEGSKVMCQPLKLFGNVIDIISIITFITLNYFDIANSCKILIQVEVQINQQR